MDTEAHLDGVIDMISEERDFLRAENERLREALTIMLYEATRMSPAGSVGDQLCRIPAGALARARAALQPKKGEK